MVPDLFPHEEKVHYVTMVCQINAATPQLPCPTYPRWGQENTPVSIDVSIDTKHNSFTISPPDRLFLA